MSFLVLGRELMKLLLKILVWFAYLEIHEENKFGVLYIEKSSFSSGATEQTPVLSSD